MPGPGPLRQARCRPGSRAPRTTRGRGPFPGSCAAARPLGPPSGAHPAGRASRTGPYGGVCRSRPDARFPGDGRMAGRARLPSSGLLPPRTEGSRRIRRIRWIRWRPASHTPQPAEHHMPAHTFMERHRIRRLHQRLFARRRGRTIFRRRRASSLHGIDVFTTIGRPSIFDNACATFMANAARCNSSERSNCVITRTTQPAEVRRMRLFWSRLHCRLSVR